jgi:hypothetical protein
LKTSAKSQLRPKEKTSDKHDRGGDGAPCLGRERDLEDQKKDQRGNGVADDRHRHDVDGKESEEDQDQSLFANPLRHGRAKGRVGADRDLAQRSDDGRDQQKAETAVDQHGKRAGPQHLETRGRHRACLEEQAHRHREKRDVGQEPGDLARPLLCRPGVDLAQGAITSARRSTVAARLAR